MGDEQTERFLSIEPQWEDFPLARHLGQIHWVIQGGEWGAAAKPFDLAWARRLRDESRTGGVAHFLKQLGEKPCDGKRELELGDMHGGNWAEWPEDLRVRGIPTAASG